MFLKPSQQHQLQLEQCKPWLPHSSTSLRSQILNQYHFLTYTFLSSLFVGQMGRQQLLYCKSFFSNKIKYSLLWPLSSLFVLKSIPGFPLYHFLIFLSRFSFSLLIFFSTKCSYFSCVLNP